MTITNLKAANSDTGGEGVFMVHRQEANSHVLQDSGRRKPSKIGIDSMRQLVRWTCVRSSEDPMGRSDILNFLSCMGFHADFHELGSQRRHEPKLRERAVCEFARPPDRPAALSL